MEGTRPVLVEIQALVSPTTMPTPRRAVVGWDTNRLAMLIAVLQTRYGVFLGDKEVYLNIAGGLKINEPAADFAVAVALISAARDIPIDPDYVIFGELGLSGEVRPVAHADVRIKEASKLGFKRGLVPSGTKGEKEDFPLYSARHISDVKSLLFSENKGQSKNSSAPKRSTEKPSVTDDAQSASLNKKPSYEEASFY
jgi:predicted ATP-dependent serine protease